MGEKIVLKIKSNEMKKNLVSEQKHVKNNSMRKKTKEMKLEVRKRLKELKTNLKLSKGVRRPELKMVHDLRPENAGKPAKKKSMRDKRPDKNVVHDQLETEENLVLSNW